MTASAAEAAADTAVQVKAYDSDFFAKVNFLLYKNYINLNFSPSYFSYRANWTTIKCFIERFHQRMRKYYIQLITYYKY